MENLFESTLAKVTDALNALQIPYAMTGSVAGSIHGEPYASQDVDLILIASPAQAAQLADRLDGFYADRETLVDAARDLRMINVIDMGTSLKVDLSFVAARGYLKEAIDRGVPWRISITGKDVQVTSPEDVILMKLLWRRDTQSAKQWENALGVVRTQRQNLDWAYLNKTGKELGIANDLKALQDEAGM